MFSQRRTSTMQFYFRARPQTTDIPAPPISITNCRLRDSVRYSHLKCRGSLVLTFRRTIRLAAAGLVCVWKRNKLILLLNVERKRIDYRPSRMLNFHADERMQWDDPWKIQGKSIQPGQNCEMWEWNSRVSFLGWAMKNLACWRTWNEEAKFRINRTASRKKSSSKHYK